MDLGAPFSELLTALFLAKWVALSVLLAASLCASFLID